MIDFTFIAELEGSTKKGIVPDAERSNSGVTIGCGFDIGQRSAKEIENAFDSELAKKLLPYIGLKKESACKKLDDEPLNISSKQELMINQFCHADAELRIQHLWNRTVEEKKFEDLHAICQTVIASVAFQYGNLSKATPNFWQQVTSNNWNSALKNLRNFGDNYKTRRNKEADLLEQYINEYH